MKRLRQALRVRAELATLAESLAEGDREGLTRRRGGRGELTVVLRALRVSA